jgi:hypothetical protein
MPIIQDVQYGQDNSIDKAPTLTAEEEETLKKRMVAMDKLLAEKELAKYKIEIMFEFKRSARNPTFGIMSFWESGSKLHGGGDTRIYICAGKSTKKADCDAFIPDSSAGYGHLVCPNCKNVWKGDDVTGEIGARLTMQNWAVLLHKYFMKLEGNCDIYMKYPKHDIRALAALEQAKQLGGEQLAKMRKEQQRCIYPLRNIIKDVSTGSDMLTKFYAFLKA